MLQPCHILRVISGPTSLEDSIKELEQEEGEKKRKREEAEAAAAGGRGDGDDHRRGRGVGRGTFLCATGYCKFQFYYN